MRSIHRMIAGVTAMAGVMVCSSTVLAATLVNVKLVNTADSVAYSGVVYAGQYTLEVDGVPILAVCDDFNTHVTIGLTWQAWLYTPAEVAGGAGKFAGQGRYEEIGWIFGQMNSMTPYQRARAQAAIWNLNGANPPLDALATSYRDQAIDGTHNTWSPNMWLLTANPLGASQEFGLNGTGLTQVPLPEPFWLLSAGILGIAGVARRHSPL